MKIKNLKINKKLVSVLLLGGITLTSLTGCENNNGKQLLQEQVWSLQNQLADRDRQISALKEELSQYKNAEDEIMNNSNEENVSDSLSDENIVKQDITVEVSQNEVQNEDTVQQISIVDDYTISSKNLIALVGSNRTLFVRYNNLSDKEVEDIFTHENYYNINVASLVNFQSEVTIYGEIYTPKNVCELIPQLKYATVTEVPATWLKEACLKSMKESPTIEGNKEDLTIDLQYVCALFDGEKTLFVTPGRDNGTALCDIFTLEVYFFNYDIKQTITDLYKTTNGYDISIYGKEYRLIPMSFYPDVIANIKDGKISIDVLKQLFEKLNDIGGKAVSEKGNPIFFPSIVDMVLKNDDRTLYVHYRRNKYKKNTKELNYLIDSFTNEGYYFTVAKNTASNVEDIWNGYCVLINGETYQAEPISLQPLIVKYSYGNFKIDRNILYESFLLANGISKEGINELKTLVLK